MIDIADGLFLSVTEKVPSGETLKLNGEKRMILRIMWRSLRGNSKYNFLVKTDLAWLREKYIRVSEDYEEESDGKVRF